MLKRASPCPIISSFVWQHSARELPQFQKDVARTRGNLHSTAQDTAQRSRKKKKVARGEDSGYSSAGHGSSGGKRALYHRNYCEKDVTGKVRIKCAECLDFGLCAECFSVGAEVGPHKSNHPYRVMGIEMYELRNWAGVADHVGTKSKEKCIEHYSSAYGHVSCCWEKL